METKNKVQHKGKRLIITGIPTIGKTNLAKQLAEAVGGICVSSEEIRNYLRSNPKYTATTYFWKDKNKRAYYIKTPYNQQWKNLVTQSEQLWEGVLEKINSYKDEERPVIFEGVGMLPHLVHQDLDFPCVVIIGINLKEVIEANKERPEWDSEELELQSVALFLGDQPYFKKEAEKYNYPVFKNDSETLKEALKILQ
ncbi:MAG: hypothetical protein WCW93_01430 [Candidatus Paceibacterota bacterium]